MEDLNTHRHYKEKLIIMPHCYFVNSHRSAALDAITNDVKYDKQAERIKYRLLSNRFVYCYHSRPDKIDD